MGKLIAFNPQKGLVKNSFHSEYEGEFLGSIWSMVAYQDDYLLAGTLDGGILVLDKKKKVFIQQFKHSEANKNSLNNNRVRELYLDKQDNLWVSRYAGGIAYANIHKIKFQDIEELAGRRIHAIFEDKTNKNYWVGLNKELRVYDRNKKPSHSFKNYQDAKTGQILPATYPISEDIDFIFQDREQALWAIVTRFLYKIDLKNQQLLSVKHYDKKVNDVYTLNNGSTLLVLEDSLAVFQNKPPYQPLSFKPLGAYRQAFYTQIFEDQFDHLYLSENAARLLIFSKQQAYQLEQTIENIGYCHHFYEDKKQQVLWVATSKGLIKLNTATFEWKMLNEPEDGLPQEVYYSVIPDENGKIWLSSNKGIVRYAPKEKSFHHFSEADGLQGKEFMPNVALKSSTGEIWMGGTKGLNVFHPDEIEQTKLLRRYSLQRFWSTMNLIIRLPKLEN